MKDRQTLKEKIYNQIIDGIVSGEYKSGQILNEKELVDRYDVSKAPVREALLILSSEGVLTNIPRYGYRVVSFTLEDVADIIEFRSAMEDYVLVKGFSRIQKADIQEMQRMVDADGQKDCGVWQHWDINENFHLKLAAFAENEYIFHQLKNAMDYLKLAYAQFYWSQWSSASIPNDLKNHSRILEALEEHDLELARLYLKRDLKDFCMK